MGKKRKCQDKSESIDANKKSKQIKNVIAKDVIENVNENSDTDIQLGLNKNIKGEKTKETVAENVNENSDSDIHLSCKEKIKGKKSKEKIAENVNENIDTDVHLSFNKVNGKKNKEKTAKNVVDEARTTGLQSANQRKRKNKKNRDTITENVFESQEGEVSVQVNSNEKRKDQNIKDGLSIDHIKNVSENVMESVVPSTNNFRAITNSCTPKKIIFVDDEPQEVSATTNKTKENKSFKKRKELYNDTLKEEDVKDEDIDKFCDELDEEDNKQYEDWVQLIEASLSSNKKKPK